MKSKWPRFPLLGFIVKISSIIAIIGLILSYFAPFVHPDTFWPIAFFGLIYPIFCFFTVLFVLVHLYMRSRWSLVLMVALLLGGKLHMRQLALTASEALPSNGLKVLSYNVRLFDLYNEDVESSNITRRKIFDFLKTENADVICFQEFYTQEKSTNFPTKDSLLPLLNIVDLQERYSQRSKGRHNFGIVTLSKYPIISKGEVPLEENAAANNNNYCIFADIVKDQDTFRVYNVHLQSIKLNSGDYLSVDSNGELIQEKKQVVENVVKKLKKAYHLRATQARKVSEHTLESPYPVIICGDFNDTPMSYTYNQFNKFYLDAFRESSFGIGATYAGKIPAGRIDYIFHSKDLIGTNFLLQEEVLSDHRAISCWIVRNPTK